MGAKEVDIEDNNLIPPEDQHIIRFRWIELGDVDLSFGGAGVIGYRWSDDDIEDNVIGSKKEKENV